MTDTPLLGEKAPRRMTATKEPYGSTDGSVDGEKVPSKEKELEVEQQTVIATPVKRLGGLGLSVLVILLVAFSWAVSTQFSKSALTIDKKNFYAPYFMMWFSTTFMILCYPMFLLYAVGFRRQSFADAHGEAVRVFKGRGIGPLSLAKYVFPFLCLWVAANYTYARSLGSISASVATSISSCNTAIVYILSMIVLREKFYVHKLLSVVFAVGGVVVMSFDGDISGHPVGIILSVLSATSAAVYKVSFKRVIGSASFPQVSLFMTCLGFLNLFINAPPAFGLLFTPWEWVNFGAVPWGPIVGNAILSLVFNFSINFGIAVLSPIVISVGMLVGIPLSTAIDVVFRGVDPTVFFLTGTGLIFISFMLIIMPIDLLKKIRCCSSGVRDTE